MSSRTYEGYVTWYLQQAVRVKHPDMRVRVRQDWDGRGYRYLECALCTHIFPRPSHLVQQTPLRIDGVVLHPQLCIRSSYGVGEFLRNLGGKACRLQSQVGFLLSPWWDDGKQPGASLDDCARSVLPWIMAPRVPPPSTLSEY